MQNKLRKYLNVRCQKMKDQQKRYFQENQERRISTNFLMDLDKHIKEGYGESLSNLTKES